MLAQIIDLRCVCLIYFSVFALSAFLLSYLTIYLLCEDEDGGDEGEGQEDTRGEDVAEEEEEQGVGDGEGEGGDAFFQVDGDISRHSTEDQRAEGGEGDI